MPDKYEPSKIEERWRNEWEEKKIYAFNLHSKKPAYVIDTPPPFPTGEFHMGGVLNWCYMDFAARYKRMRGHEVLFPQGWDCHGFPTEVKVEKKYGKNLGKEEFRQRCLEWTHEVVGTMKPQMRQMGFSIDWAHEYYTIDKEYYRKIQYSLLKMHKEGDVYHAEHPVLFCTHCCSAIAKAEVEDVERDTLLNDVVFKTDAGDVIIATTRPELLHACVAVFVHPQDHRYQQLVGKSAVVPLFGQRVPIKADADVDKDFGTGLVMVCTFGDKQDVVWAYRHHLPVIKACDENGRLTNAHHYNGVPIHQAKEKILEELKTKGLLVNQKPLLQVVKVHDRCKKPVELLNSIQWFIRLRGYEEDVKKASASMSWFPEHARQLLLDWVEGLEWDWCISRQRFFGIPIPFWYCMKCGKVFSPKEEELPVDPSTQPYGRKCECGGEVKGEESVCDGWVDSSITPLIISGWPSDEEKFKKLYPNTVRPQGTDIIRTWAFYTIFRCTRLTGKPPFKEMLINGMVLGNDGKKMSKSQGNYVEAKDVIAKNGVDALRQWAALCGSTGKDNVFYWKDVYYAQSFLNKLWNASKFILTATEGPEDNEEKNKEGKKTNDIKQNEKKKGDEGKNNQGKKAAGEQSEKESTLRLNVVDHWMRSRLQKTVQKATACLDKYQYYEALTAVQSFFWHDVCDFYLEDVKHRVYGADGESKGAAQATLQEVLGTTLKLLAPFAPYTTEEIWSQRHEESVHLSEWPYFEKEKIHEEYEKLGDALHQALSSVRKFKASRGISLNAPLASVKIRASQALCERFADVLGDFKATAKAQTVEFDVLPAAENEWALELECNEF